MQRRPTPAEIEQEWDRQHHAWKAAVDAQREVDGIPASAFAVAGAVQSGTRSWALIDTAFYLVRDYARCRGHPPPTRDLERAYISMDERRANLEALAARFPHVSLVWRD
jgi:hypothetical protein